MTEEKQIEEMAEQLIDIQRKFNEYCAKPCRSCELGGIVNCENHYKAEALYNEGYRKQEWISVEERLPENLQEVLAYRGNHIGNLMNTYTYVGGDMWQDEYGFGCRQEDEGITHWMPLPEPPKMKGE